MSVDPILIISAVVIVFGGLLICVVKDALLSLNKTRRIRTFRWCIYGGGTNMARYRSSRIARVVVREGSIDFGGLYWGEKELEVPRSKLRGIRRVESERDVESSGIQLVRDFGKLAARNARWRRTWNWVILTWEGGNAIVQFPMDRYAAEFVRLMEQVPETTAQQ